jgi:hypothetical protein
MRHCDFQANPQNRMHAETLDDLGASVEAPMVRIAIAELRGSTNLDISEDVVVHVDKEWERSSNQQGKRTVRYLL